ncbi:MAG: nucleotide pyrophosphohydrolase [Bacteriovoracaceae bacterium]|nr:nucleotide pyrophosphohydrolase [Bacteriovoracaceae bacterium]
MLDTAQIQEKISQFAREREWEKFHTPKNIAMALTVEASELMEQFQWLTAEEANSVMSSEKAQAVKHEVADVAVYLLRLCDLLKIDLQSAIEEKIQLNAKKYPIEKSKGHARKYDEL